MFRILLDVSHPATGGAAIYHQHVWMRSQSFNRNLKRWSASILAGFLLFTAQQASATTPETCVGDGLPVGVFKLQVAPPQGGPPLPLNSVNRINAGDKLIYTPVELPHSIKDHARIAAVVVPEPKAAKKHAEVLEARPADAATEWTVPMRASVIGVVFGPHGLDVKKVNALVRNNPQLISELADYTQKTKMVNALVKTLSQYEQSTPGSEDLNAALRGFSSQFGVGLPALTPGAPTEQQASVLLHAVLPTLSNTDPLASGRTEALEQSAGLATTVAALFYGTPVGLAVGGAALVQNLRTLAFPATDFRAAFTQPSTTGGLDFCAVNQPPKPRTRIAYLWMLRPLDAEAPKAALAGPENLPLGSSAAVRVNSPSHAELDLLPHARDWRLVSPNHSDAIPVKVTVGPSNDTLALDLSKASLPPGRYQLAALWDWRVFHLGGTVQLHPYSDFSSVQITPQSEDGLVEGGGPVEVQLKGADFEFVDKAAIQRTGSSEVHPQAIPFTLPKGLDAGEQSSMEAQVNTNGLKAGAYALLLTQTNGRTQGVAVTVHPPNPRIDGLPLRANLGEAGQSLVLHGSGLDRIEKLSSPQAILTLSPIPAGSGPLIERTATITLRSGLHPGELLSARMTAAGITKSIKIPEFVRVAGPRPKILSVKASFAEENSVALAPDELPAAATVGFAVRAGNAGAHPSLDLSCSNSSETRRALHLQPGDENGDVQFDYTGVDTLFLSLEPGTVGESGCLLTAQITNPDTGASDPYVIGRVIRLPRIDKFSLSGRRLGSSLYAGALTGRNLQMIEKTGWNSTTGFAVNGIPVPVPGDPQEQTLEIELPWPPPAPQAPLYVWLRGEPKGRKTTARYN
ncbi:MAG: hypothetical protein ACRD1J_02230 [Terriglobia bacterium]